MYNYICDPSYSRWYEAKYLLSPVQSPVQMTVKIVLCKIVSASDCLEDGLALCIIAVLISQKTEHS